ncbi:hypothetical protein BDN71DRAFT_305171 [Pleurotus eryngii]|uniref:Uncharacterized protein n=1 Tax=Pleurotus eryngii TaxID=5323 RepID=A0A9P6A4G9_PLEER|nr:hypothetical protein BDN71DRAFT_305171 [Pleurotus eryngii]
MKVGYDTLLAGYFSYDPFTRWSVFPRVLGGIHDDAALGPCYIRSRVNTKEQVHQVTTDATSGYDIRELVSLHAMNACRLTTV